MTKSSLKAIRSLILSLPIVWGLQAIPAAADASANLCGPVYNGAVINFAFECWNDATFLIPNSTRRDANGWEYVEDGGFNDYAGAEFEIRGIALKETDTEVFIAINSYLPFDTGAPYPDATNGSVTFGDLFINFSGLDFVTASDQRRLHAIRFDSKNDSSALQLGVYKNVKAKSVVVENLGPNNRQGYENHVNAKGGTVGYGDLSANMTYFPLNSGLNEIEQGDLVGGITLLTGSTLSAAGFDSTYFNGPHTVGFKFTKTLIIDECGVVGGDGSSCRDCAGVTCGKSVLDECGVCGGNGSTCADCKGTPNGEAQIDICGVCGGDGTSCLDCSGTPYGRDEIDRCGVCGGDGKSCLGCNDIDITQKIFGLDGNSARQTDLLVGALNELRKAGRRSAKIKALVDHELVEAKKLGNANWQLSWTLPQVVSQCANADLCFSVDLSDTVEGYRANARALFGKTKQIASLLKKYPGKAAMAGRFVKKAEKTLNRALGISHTVPSSQSVCL